VVDNLKEWVLLDHEESILVIVNSTREIDSIEKLQVNLDRMLEQDFYFPPEQDRYQVLSEL
jgi:hypothetical protein